jgi:hypothetical protein
MSAVSISPSQLDSIAATFRARGRTHPRAQAEWLALSNADREWWRTEVTIVLATGNVLVAR